MINYYNKQLNEKISHDSVGGSKNMFSDGPTMPTMSTTTSSASSFRPYGNMLSTNNQYINNIMSPTPSGFMPQNKLTTGGATSPTAALNIGLASELDLTGGNPVTAAAARLGVSSQGTNGYSSKNPLVSSSASSIQQQQQQHIDHSKENLEM